MRFGPEPPGAMNYAVPTGSEATRDARYTTDVTLSDFMSRPVLIDQRTWTPNANVHHTYNPWEQFFTNKRVMNRVASYNMMRCRLKVKIVINGNGFYFGRAIASYLPHAVLDDMSKNDSMVPQHIIQASQQPHIYLNPTTSTGGTLELPFFYFYDFFSIPDVKWTDMGEITLRSINELQHANNDTTPITISTFAWAEDVQLAIPTSINPIGLAAQSGIRDETDEANATGKISGPATAIAAAANQLKTVPYISPYATATELGARMIAGLAKLMGYSRPTVTKTPEPYQPTNGSSMALCTVPDRVEKLTVDDKQGLGMGQEIAGIKSQDPLSILSIAQRESYLTTFVWAPTDSPGDLLWNARVNPLLHDTYLDTALSPNQLAYCYPALAIATLPFDYWVGTINFRFQVVASAFHKGRLRVVYDPLYLADTPEYNVNYQEIVDLSDRQEITISISHSQERGIIPVLDDAPADLYRKARFTSYNDSNGVVGIYVLNDLSVPTTVADQDVQINVFVSAGDDFKVFSPNEYIQNFGFVPQSGIVQDPDQAEATMPLSDGTPLTNDVYVPDPITSVYAGECIGSFRQLLKRYNKIGTLDRAAVSGDQVMSITRNAFPYLRGHVPGYTVDTSVVAGTPGYNYVLTPMLHFMTMPFAAWRGSIRHKMMPQLFNESSGPIYQSARRSYAGGTSTTLINYDTLGSTNEARYDGVTQAAVLSCPHGGSGMAYQSSTVNDVFTFEIPYQRETRYSMSKLYNWTASDASCNAFVYNLAGNLATNAQVNWYAAAGEDFQVYFWTGMPPLYYNASTPLPA